MKISYILQLKDFFVLFILGISIGVVYGILNAFSTIKKMYLLQIVVDIVFCIVSVIIFILAVNIINWGEFRIFLLIGYALGFTLERITLGKLFAKAFPKVYNSIYNNLKRFAKSKIGRIIFK